MAERPRTEHYEIGVKGPHTGPSRKGGNLMTADQLKRKFRNFPEAHLRLRIATA
jgi:hypothetical protein